MRLVKIGLALILLLSLILMAGCQTEKPKITVLADSKPIELDNTTITVDTSAPPISVSADGVTGTVSVYPAGSATIDGDVSSKIAEVQKQITVENPKIAITLSGTNGGQPIDQAQLNQTLNGAPPLVIELTNKGTGETVVDSVAVVWDPAIQGYTARITPEELELLKQKATSGEIEIEFLQNAAIANIQLSIEEMKLLIEGTK